MRPTVLIILGSWVRAPPALPRIGLVVVRIRRVARPQVQTRADRRSYIPRIDLGSLTFPVDSTNEGRGRNVDHRVSSTSGAGSRPGHDRRRSDGLGGLALHSSSSGSPRSDEPSISERLVEKLKPVEGDAGDESKEAATGADQYAQARTAPGGIVAPGAYSAAWASLSSLPSSGGTWTEETTAPDNADDPNYRECYHSNSSGGAGFVSGRVTGLATIAGAGTGGADVVFAGGADGGVFPVPTS